MTLQEIYKALLDETGVKCKVLANDNTPALNYFQIQYNESDLDFILRFLAEAGISFFFEHSASEHKMVLVNSASMYTKKPEKLRFSISGVA
jgi:type VI secretion system secreted protein VgrG